MQQPIKAEFPFTLPLSELITHLHADFCLDRVTAVGMFQQARQAFFQAHQFADKIDNVELVLLSSTYSFKQDIPKATDFVVKLGFAEHTRSKFKLVYHVSDQDQQEILSGGEVFSFYDLNQGALSEIPPAFLTFCQSSQVVGNNLPAKELIVS